jgi:hypothetical protein
MFPSDKNKLLQEYDDYYSTLTFEPSVNYSESSTYSPLHDCPIEDDGDCISNNKKEAALNKKRKKSKPEEHNAKENFESIEKSLISNNYQRRNVSFNEHIEDFFIF